MAAEAATEVTVKKAVVVPSRTIPQGLAAMLRLIPDGDFESVVEEMNAALGEIETGEITTATRSVEIDGVTVQKGQIIALHNGKLVCSAKSLQEACLGLLEQVHTEDFELVTLFCGQDAPKGETNLIADAIRSTYPELEVEIQEGGQPHYQFIISIE